MPYDAVVGNFVIITQGLGDVGWAMLAKFHHPRLVLVRDKGCHALQ